MQRRLRVEWCAAMSRHPSRRANWLQCVVLQDRAYRAEWFDLEAPEGSACMRLKSLAHKSY